MTYADTDIAIIGAGPAGLAMALAAARLGLRIQILERQKLDDIANPQDDGREISLTHRSVDFLKATGIWKHMPVKRFGHIRQAIVRNEQMAAQLCFASARTGRDQLAHIVPNHLIRKAAYDAAAECKNIRIRSMAECRKLDLAEDDATVVLQGGEKIRARLLLAADGRFSATRRLAGIDVATHPFGRTMIVARLAHEKSHSDCAYEWFQRERTLAMLPLAGNISSAVLTVDEAMAQALMKLDDASYAQTIETWFEGKYGKMKMAGARYAYPLVATYADRFCMPSFALIGDAAVGMHPVTAHGFNFGLRGAETLCSAMAGAMECGEDFAAADVLFAYERQHRRHTRPLYLATNFIATLYSRTDAAALVARRLLVGAGHKMGFVQDFISRRLTDVAA